MKAWSVTLTVLLLSTPALLMAPTAAAAGDDCRISSTIPYTCIVVNAGGETFYVYPVPAGYNSDFEWEESPCTVWKESNGWPGLQTEWVTTRSRVIPPDTRVVCLL